MFMHHLSAQEAAAYLRERLVALEVTIGKFRSVLELLLGKGIARLSLIEVEHKIAMLEAERNWVARLETEISEGKLEWNVGMASDHEALRRRHGASA
jgi:hypothetical protein